MDTFERYFEGVDAQLDPAQSRTLGPNPRCLFLFFGSPSHERAHASWGGLRTLYNSNILKEVIIRR